jgi:hypothetical protein
LGAAQHWQSNRDNYFSFSFDFFISPPRERRDIRRSPVLFYNPAGKKKGLFLFCDV